MDADPDEVVLVHRARQLLLNRNVSSLRALMHGHPDPAHLLLDVARVVTVSPRTILLPLLRTLMQESTSLSAAQLEPLALFEYDF